MLQAIRQIQRELNGQLPLIGFAGAPFTLASYAIEGGHSNSFAKTKALMFGHPDAWHRLCGMLAELVGDYLVAQIEAGVDVGAGVRLVGRRAQCRRLPRVRAAPLPPDLRDRRQPGAHDPLRHRHGDDAGRHARSRRRRDWRRLAHSDRRSLGSHRPRPRHPGQSRSDDAARARGPHVPAGGRHHRARRRPPRPHLQPRPRHPADHAARARADAGQLRPPRDGSAAAVPPDVRRCPSTSSSSAAASPAWRLPTTCSGAAARCACSTPADARRRDANRTLRRLGRGLRARLVPGRRSRPPSRSAASWASSRS